MVDLQIVEPHWCKAHQASARVAKRIEANRRRQLALCVKNDGYAASLEVKKVYAVLKDSAGSPRDCSASWTSRASPIYTQRGISSASRFPLLPRRFSPRRRDESPAAVYPIN